MDQSTKLDVKSDSNADNSLLAIILLADEPNEYVAIKLICWIAVMVVFILWLLWYVGKFDEPKYDFDMINR